MQPGKGDINAVSDATPDVGIGRMSCVNDVDEMGVSIRSLN
jgi:hypothetical protein